MASVGDIDFSGSDAVAKLVPEIARSGITLALCDVDEDLLAQLKAYDLIKVVGEDRIFATSHDAIAAYLALPAPAACRPRRPQPRLRSSRTRPQCRTRTAISTPKAASTRIAAAAMEASRSPLLNSL